MAAMLRTEWYTIKVQYRDESLGHFAAPGRSGAAWSSSRSAAHIGGISRKVLTQTLRRLQQYGLVERRAEAPRRVEYRLTDLGRTLVEPIEVLNNWARDYGEAIVDFQEAAEAATSARARAAG